MKRSSSASSRVSSYLIYVTVVLDAMALGTVFPLLPKLIHAISKSSIGDAAHLFGLFGALFMLMQFIASPIQGALSDRFGRRPVILASNFGLGVDSILMAVAPTLPWLFVARIIGGAAAGSYASANAYLADITAPEERATAFGRLSAAFAFGAVIGPAFGGVLGGWDLRAPFWAAGVLSLVNGLYGVFVLPESLPLDRRAPLSWARINPFSAILSLWREYPPLKSWSLVVLLLSAAFWGMNTVVVLFTTYRFHWTSFEIGLLLASIGICQVAAKAGLLSFAVDWLGERRVMITGLMLQIAATIGVAMARNGVEFCAAIVLFCIGGAEEPARASIMSQSVGPSDQGRLQGLIRSVDCTAGVVAPITFAAVFAAAIDSRHAPIVSGAPFAIASVLTACAAAVAVWTTRRGPYPGSS
jgi:DHA1 family tetracycline resistance protein-like MFS transporter